MVGQWNPAIFSPDWVAHNLLHIENVEAQLAVGPLVTNVRYQTETLLVIPQQDRLIVGGRNAEEATLLEMERCSKAALELLGHTPIRALGINFGFIESDPPTEMLRTFDLADAGALSDAGYQVRATDITRSIDIGSTILKLKMSFSNEGTVRFHFNFTSQVATSQQAAELLQGRVLDYRNKALDILSAVFNLQGEGVI
ncbi:MAG: hypothetical protein WAU17_17560 [Nitrospirales bacterium]